MSHQECLIFVAYLKYLKTLNGPRDRHTLATENLDAADVDTRDLKPHRPEPIRQRRKLPYTLEELLAQMTDDNSHAEIDTGPAVGSEVWWD